MPCDGPGVVSAQARAFTICLVPMQDPIGEGVAPCKQSSAHGTHCCSPRFLHSHSHLSRDEQSNMQAALTQTKVVRLAAAFAPLAVPTNADYAPASTDCRFTSCWLPHRLCLCRSWPPPRPSPAAPLSAWPAAPCRRRRSRKAAALPWAFSAQQVGSGGRRERGDTLWRAAGSGTPRCGLAAGCLTHRQETHCARGFAARRGKAGAYCASPPPRSVLLAVLSLTAAAAEATVTSAKNSSTATMEGYNM